MTKEPKTRFSVVIEPEGFDPSRVESASSELSSEAGFDSRRISLSAREAFRLNANPLELMARYEQEEWRAVLREIERHQEELKAQRSPEQSKWAGAAARRCYVGTGRAAEMIANAL